MDLRKVLGRLGVHKSTEPKVAAATHEVTSVPTLLGIAIDVSGSMQESIANTAAADLSRLDGVSRGFEALLADSRRLAQTYGGSQSLPLRIFSYAFGVTVDPGYADLLGILSFASSM